MRVVPRDLNSRPGAEAILFRGFLLKKSRPALRIFILMKKERTDMEFLTGVSQKELFDIAEITEGDFAGKNVRMRGAIHTIREMGEVAFIVLRKRDGLVQCVYEEASRSFPSMT
jgi:lysyl-tRNA synthetase class II